MLESRLSVNTVVADGVNLSNRCIVGAAKNRTAYSGNKSIQTTRGLGLLHWHISGGQICVG
jgi:hypothetical protein